MLLLLFGGARVAPPNPTGETVLVKEKHSGAAFTRKKWKELQTALEAERQAELEVERLRLKAIRERVKGEAAKARATVLAERQAQERVRAEQSHIRQLEAAAGIHGAVQNIINTALQSATVMAAAKAHHDRTVDQDEDEAIALLLLNG